GRGARGAPGRRARGARWGAAGDLGERRRRRPSPRWGVARRPAECGGPLAVRHQIAPATPGTGVLSRSRPSPSSLLLLLLRAASQCRTGGTLDDPGGGGYMKQHKLPVRGSAYGSTDVGVGRRGEGPALGPAPRRHALSPAVRRVVSRAGRGVARRRPRCAWHATERARVVPGRVVPRCDPQAL